MKRPFLSWFASRIQNRHGLLYLLLALALAVGALTRLGLLIYAGSGVTWNIGVPFIFIVGAVYDAGASMFWLAPLALVLAALPNRFVGHWSSRIFAFVVLAVAAYALLFGVVSEFLFWEEFGVRFNFIAVDYLVYTQEVIGNIRESYPMPLIFSGIGVLSVLVLLGIWRSGYVSLWQSSSADSLRKRWGAAGLWVLMAVLTGLGLHQDYIPSFGNAYNRELAKDGLWSLFAAFRANQLDYEHFYPTMPVDAAFARVQSEITGKPQEASATVEKDLMRAVEGQGLERRLNVIQITVESLSAEFLTRYGSKEGITPNLDALLPKSLVFDNLYATGTRTDRGMEALTLSVPPTPGRSLVKRPDNGDLFTLGSVLNSKGYVSSFIYGGYGYFDNMNAFFGGNGYRVLDRTQVAKSEISFSNVWGACDEDLLRWTTRQADLDAASGKPFFHFVMTTSNHRPYTYPEGRIDLPSKTSGRRGGVKYTDFAIAQFLREASTHSWYNNTVFVIVADHCASSAGRAELPVEKYRIPMIIYTPGAQIKPGVVNTLCSQVDYAPTLLGLLGMSYSSRFFGVDLLDQPKGWVGRALIGNYQKLGYFTEGHLTVLSPLRRFSDYSYDRTTNDLKPLAERSSQVDDAIAIYETASWLFKNKKQTVSAQSKPVAVLAHRH